MHRRTPTTGSSASDIPHRQAAGAGIPIRSPGSSTSRRVWPSSPGFLPGLRPDAFLEAPPRGHQPGPSDDGGLDEFAKPLPSFSTSAYTCAVSSPTCTSSASIRASLAACDTSPAASSSSRDSSSGQGTRRFKHDHTPGHTNPASPRVATT
jgi:hypothetical protein